MQENVVYYTENYIAQVAEDQYRVGSQCSQCS